MSTILVVAQGSHQQPHQPRGMKAGRAGGSSGAEIPLIRGTATHDDAIVSQITSAGGLGGWRTVRRVAGSPAANETGSTAVWAAGRAAAGEPEPGPALQPGDRDGGGEAEGQRQGRAGGLEPGRRGRGGAQLGLLEGGGNRQDPPPADRPDDDEGPADHGVLRDRAAARLAEVVP